MSEQYLADASAHLELNLRLRDPFDLVEGIPYLEQVTDRREIFARHVAAIALRNLTQIELDALDIREWEARPHAPPSDLIDLALPAWVAESFSSTGADWVIREAAFEATSITPKLLPVSATVIFYGSPRAD
jgi:hypothetical protein